MNTSIQRARTTLAPRARLRRAKQLVQRYRDRPMGTRARLRALEEEVQENRQLHRRLAELTDVVTELLLPLEQRDEDRARPVIEEYRTNLV